MSKEAILGYMILFIGVVIGWALGGIWDSVRKRMRKKSKTKFAEVEYMNGEFRIVEEK